MKITDDVRAYAAERGYAEDDTEKVLEEQNCKADFPKHPKRGKLWADFMNHPKLILSSS